MQDLPLHPVPLAAASCHRMCGPVFACAPLSPLQPFTDSKITADASEPCLILTWTCALTSIEKTACQALQHLPCLLLHLSEPVMLAEQAAVAGSLRLIRCLACCSVRRRKWSLDPVLGVPGASQHLSAGFEALAHIPGGSDSTPPHGEPCKHCWAACSLCRRLLDGARCTASAVRCNACPYPTGSAARAAAASTPL